jgi:hypothetical protein
LLQVSYIYIILHKNIQKKVLSKFTAVEYFRIKLFPFPVLFLKVITEGQERKPVTVIRTKKVCVTPECSELSQRMLSNIDPSRDPCVSFYDFACGGWMQRNPPPPRRMVHSVMSKMRDNMDEVLRGTI